MIAQRHVGDADADLVDDAARLVAENARQHHPARHPRRPVVDLHVGAADSRRPHFQADFAGAGIARFPVADGDAADLGRDLAERAHHR